jgi:TPR repeat protein
MTTRPSQAAAMIFVALALVVGVPALGAPAQAEPISRASAAYAGGDYVTAARRLGPLAAAGYARAQTMLGFMCEYGRGVPQDYVIAASWYTRAAEQGDPAAQAALGLLYDKGRGVPQDAVLAHKWLNLAAAAARGRQREAYTLWRNAIATKMSPAQLDLAQELASEWMPRRER